MLVKAIYAASVVAMYSVFLTEYKKKNPDESVTTSHRVATLIVAVFWPLTMSVAAVMYAVGAISRSKPNMQTVGTNGYLALVWIVANPETPVILSDIHGRHMMKARSAAIKIRGGVCPTQFQVYTKGGEWEHLDIQEVPQ